MNTLLKLKKVNLKYQTGKDIIRVLKDINLTAKKKETISIVGESGSGKTSLIMLIGGLERATSGKIFFQNHEITKLNEDEVSEIRKKNIGIIFQSFYLIPNYTAVENIALTLELNKFKNPEKALKNAKGIFVGGGNSFVLLNELYKLNLMQALKSVIISGTPYLGTSAGSNLCGPSIGTSNDMPIVYPPSFEALGIIPFNINPHYIDPQPESKHMGETRATRIKEFHHYNSQSVLGLREGSFLEITGDEITLKGTLKARVFKQGVLAYEIDSGTDLSDFK